MTKGTILATSMLALAMSFAYSNVSPPSFAAGTPNIGASSAGTIGGASGLGNAAGSIAAGANSTLNPSGNSFIVPPPGAISAGGFIRPQR
jgi:hypothetical protein